MVLTCGAGVCYGGARHAILLKDPKTFAKVLGPKRILKGGHLLLTQAL